jgi:hypothetical protein
MRAIEAVEGLGILHVPTSSPRLLAAAVSFLGAASQGGPKTEAASWTAVVASL